MDHRSILEYALTHLRRDAEEIQAKIAHVMGQLGALAPKPAAAAAPAVKSAAAKSPAAAQPVVRKVGRPRKVVAEAPVAVAAPVDGRKSRVLSEAARARIAAAQKRRWAAHRKAQGGKG